MQVPPHVGGQCGGDPLVHPAGRLGGVVVTRHDDRVREPERVAKARGKVEGCEAARVDLDADDSLGAGGLEEAPHRLAGNEQPLCNLGLGETVAVVEPGGTDDEIQVVG